MFPENSGRKRTLGGIGIPNGLDLQAWFRTSLLMSNNILTFFTCSCHKRGSQNTLHQTDTTALPGSWGLVCTCSVKKIVTIKKEKKNGYAI